MKLSVSPRLEMLCAGVVFAILFAALLPGALSPVSVADEGFAVYNAKRLLDGEVLYRDFLAVYAPGIFLTLAGLFRVFGETLAVERSVDLLARCLLLGLIYWHARKATSKLIALAPLAFCGFLISTLWETRGYAMYPGLCFSLLSGLLLMRCLSSGRRTHFMAAGICIGLAGVYRHDVGLYTLFAAGLMLFLGDSDSRNRMGIASSLLKKYSWTVLGAVIPVTPVFLYLLWNGALRSAWECLVVVPGTILHASRKLPFPSLLPMVKGRFEITGDWIQTYIPAFVLLLGCVLLIRRMRVRRSWSLRGPSEQVLFFSIVVGGLLFFQVWNRNDFIHRLPVTLFAAIVLTILVCEFEPPVGRVLIRSAFFDLLILYLFLFSSWVLLPEWTAMLAWLRNDPCAHSTARASCLPVEPDQIEAVRYVEANVKEGERIFVGLPQHQRVVIGDLMFYFLSNRHSGVYYHEMAPLLTTTEWGQKSIIADLIRSDVRCVVLFSGFENWREDNLSSVPSGVRLLDDYIRSHYRSAATFGNYAVLMKAD